MVGLSIDGSGSGMIDVCVLAKYGFGTVYLHNKNYEL